MKKTSLLLCASIFALMATPVLADQMNREELESIILDLRAEIQELRGMVQGIDAETQILSERTAQALDRTASYQGAGWLDKTSINGDLRLRYVHVDDKAYSMKGDSLQARARLQFVTELYEDLKVGMRLVTSPDGWSSDEVFGQWNADKDYVWFDHYYAQWTPTEWLDLLGGKFSNPFVTTSMVFAKDDPVSMQAATAVQPEGFAQIFTFGDQDYDFRLILAEVLFEELGRFRDDIWLFAAQFGGYFNLSDDFQLDAFVGYYDYTKEIKKVWTAWGNYGNDNTFGVRDDDYNVIQPYLALHYTGVENLPICVYGEYVNNLDANDDEAGFRAGLQLGQAQKENTWEIGGFYQQLEANATLDILGDAEFHGRNRTNNKGWGASAAYAIRDNWVARLTGLSSKPESGSSKRYNTIQLGMSWNF